MDTKTDKALRAETTQYPERVYPFTTEHARSRVDLGFGEVEAVVFSIRPLRQGGFAGRVTSGGLLYSVGAKERGGVWTAEDGERARL
jgi:hypothetical protein